jgi:hypothetical protein
MNLILVLVRTASVFWWSVCLVVLGLLTLLIIAIDVLLRSARHALDYCKRRGGVPACCGNASSVNGKACDRYEISG